MSKLSARFVGVATAGAVLVAVGLLALPSAALPSVLAPTVAVPTVASGRAAFAGYTGVVTAGNISVETAQFNVPSVTCQPSLPEAQIVGAHVGASGVLGNGSTVSLGMNLNVICDLGSPTPRYAPLAYDCVETNCTTRVVFSLSVTGGDNVSFRITVNASSGQVVWTIADLTSKVTQNFHLGFGTGVALSNPFWEVGGPSYPCTPTSCSQALAQFSDPIVLKSCAVTVSGSRAPVGALAYVIRYTMVNSIGGVLARSSAISHAGSQFSVRFVHST